jgi:hypothetical protein
VLQILSSADTADTAADPSKKSNSKKKRRRIDQSVSFNAGLYVQAPHASVHEKSPNQSLVRELRGCTIATSKINQ